MYQIKTEPPYEPIIVKDGLLFIPQDPMNADYLEYVQWLFDGNTPEEITIDGTTVEPDTTTESVEP